MADGRTVRLYQSAQICYKCLKPAPAGQI